MRYIPGRDNSIDTKAVCAICRQPGHTFSNCPLPQTREPRLELTATLRRTNITRAHSPKTLAETLTEALTVGGLDVLALSVREGLPIGARELPTGETESLSARLQFILDFIPNLVSGTAATTQYIRCMKEELEELLADVRKAEGI